MRVQLYTLAVLADVARQRPPSWRLSCAVWLTALIVDVAIPLRASTVDVFDCGPGVYSNLGKEQAWIVIPVALTTMWGLWRCDRHLAHEPARRRVLLVIVASLVAGAAVAIVTGSAVLRDDITVYRGDC